MKIIKFITIDQGVEQVLDRGSDIFEALYQARLGEITELAQDVTRHTLAMLASAPRESMWGGYLVVDEERAEVVGTCGFKSAPTPDGTVEIAYFTSPMFEGRGYATAMAARLSEIAESSPIVRRVIAHTLPERNASTRVLEKVGMRFTGEVNDPEDGRVWRWERVEEV